MSAADLSPRRYRVLLALVLLLALLPRLWLWLDQGSAGMVYPGDQDEYYRGAIHLLLSGSYYDSGQWLRPPLLSILLAGIFAVLGVDVAGALLVQCVLSLGTLLLLAELARVLFASRRAGLAAALLGGAFLPYASYASQLLAETLFILLAAAGLLLFEAARQRGKAWRWLLAGGLVWGLAALTRPVGLYAVPLLLLWAALRQDSTGRWRVGWRGPLALLLGCALVIAPWVARNYAVHEHVILVDTNGGTSFWLGNLLEPDERELQFVWNETIPNLAEREDAALARALDNIAREPLTFLARTRNKAVALWQFDARLFAANAPIGITREESSLPFALASDAQYVGIMLLALLGVGLARRPEISLPLLAWPLYGTLLSAVSLGHPRLRLPLLLTMLVYAALPLAHPRRTWHRLRAAARWRTLALGGGVIGLALLWYAQVYIPFGQSQFWLARAALSGSQADIERAIAAMPGNYLPHVALGEWQQAQGDPTAALAAYDQAAALAPQNTPTHLWRFALLRAQGDLEAAQAALEPVTAVSWDNNQTYVWAWRRMPLALRPDAQGSAWLPADTPAPGLLRGVYAAQEERDGRAFRWTHARAQVRLAGWNCPRTELALTLRAPQPATPVQVWYAGAQVATLTVGPAWQTLTATLPTARDSAGVLDLRAPTHVRSPDQPYARGVALAELAVRCPAR